MCLSSSLTAPLIKSFRSLLLPTIKCVGLMPVTQELTSKGILGSPQLVKWHAGRIVKGKLQSRRLKNIKEN